MSRTPPAPAWRAAFLRALGAGYGVTLAAERCGIHHSSAYQLRKRNPAFAASWERALADGRAKLAAGLAPDADAAPRRFCAGEIVRAARNGRPCIARASGRGWSTAKERAFLAHLTATGNVTASARAAGVSNVAVYNRKKLWPAFARAWDAALREGYDRIEMLLIGRATATLDPAGAVEDADPRDALLEVGPEMTAREIINLLQLHRAAARGGPAQRYDWRKREVDIEEVRAEVLRRVEVLGRVREREE